MWPNFIAGRHHAVMADAFERVLRGDCKRLIINLGPRHPFEVSTPVLTTAGWKAIVDIEIGDFVFGPDGKPTEVVEKSPIHRDRQLYAVTTDDGAEVVCDGDHRWFVRLNRKGGYQVYTTEQLWLRECGSIVKRLRSGRVDIPPARVDCDTVRAAKLPDFSGADLPSADLPIDPYVLGVWLGDGSSRQGIITMADDDAAVVRAEFERRGYRTTDQSAPQTFGVLGLKVALRDAGLLRENGVGKKFIPELYLLASLSQRMDLLRGLMDTDGNVSAAGQCMFSQKDKPFILSVRRILWSLGIKNTIQASRAKIGDRDYGETYRLSFYAKGCALLPRKADRTIHPLRKRFIRVKKLDRVGDTVCIKVARQDELFMVGHGMIVTMNTKSEFASYLLPAWFLGRFPHKKVIQCSNTGELAVGFGRKVRNLVGSEDYQKVFRGVKLSGDSKAAGRWSTNQTGEYFAIGVGGTVTGKGADLLIIDDPHSEQEAALAAGNPAVFDGVYEWYTSGPRQRLQPGGAIIVVMTRWSKRDLTGRILQGSIERQGSDQWEVIELPAIMPSGDPLWPEFWSLKELNAVRAEIPVAKWSAQYMQQPTSEEGAILKREWWQKWDRDKPPECEYVIISMDTAFTKNSRSDYTACTVWGVFYRDNADGMKSPNLILLDAFKERMEFPDLKAKAREIYREWQPDSFIIEAKASGLPLIHELRQAGIPVSDFTPTRATGDKIMRANSISDIFASGVAWAPDRRWAEEVIEECASFPSSEHDDYVDAVIMAMMRYRQGGFIRLESDEDDEDLPFAKADYY
jgi:predicted phage terminase large subunit-like protein